MCEHIIARMTERTDRTIYWHTIRSEQIADGTPTDYGPDTMP